ncbi:MAG: DivIVA domain-containing protein [Clostridia bacterium]|nr:DivIVA domain-containing protein [Clostridia bacterium]
MTPIEIQNYEFVTQKIGGYNKKQVEDFVEAVVKDFEGYYRENKELKDRITVLNESLKNFKMMEDSLQNTLLFAQNTADDIKRNAQEKAENMIEEARVSAAEILREADRKKQDAQREYEELKNQYMIFKTKFKSLLEAELNLMGDLAE